MTEKDYPTPSPLEQYERDVQAVFQEAIELYGDPAELFRNRKIDELKGIELDSTVIVAEGIKTEGVLWMSKERVVRRNDKDELELVYHINPRDLINYIVDGSSENKKRGAERKGTLRAYKITQKQQREALKDEMAVDSLIGLKPAQIRHEFDQKESKAAEVVTEYYLAAARKLYGDEIFLEDVSGSLRGLIESTDLSDHAALRGFIQAASKNCHKRFIHFQTNLKGLERKANRIGVRLDSDEPGLTEDEARQMTVDHVESVDQQVEARKDLK